MDTLDRDILRAMARIGRRATAQTIQENTIGTPPLGVIWNALLGLVAEGLLSEKRVQQKMFYAFTAKGVKALAAANVTEEKV